MNELAEALGTVVILSLVGIVSYVSYKIYRYFGGKEVEE